MTSGLRARSTSKKSSDHAVFLLKLKVVGHFAGLRPKGRVREQVAKLVRDLDENAKGIWGETTLAIPNRTNRTERTLPKGNFKTTKWTVKRANNDGLQEIPAWRTSWMPSTTAHGLSKDSKRRYFATISTVSKTQSITMCRAKVRDWHMPKDLASAKLQAAAANSHLQREVAVQEIRNMVVMVPEGKVSVFVGVEVWGPPFGPANHKSHPIRITWVPKDAASFPGEIKSFETTNLFYQLRAPVFQIMSRVAKAASGLPRIHNWRRENPKIDRTLNPWGDIEFSWEPDVIPGVSAGEVKVVHSGLPPKGLDFPRVRGYSSQWRPAREFHKLGPEIGRNWIVGFGDDPDSSIRDCFTKVSEWLDENYPVVETRPAFPPLNEEFKLSIRALFNEQIPLPRRTSGSRRILLGEKTPAK